MDLETVFKQLVWDAIVKVVIARLFAALPWLGWGPVGLVVGLVITTIADKIFHAIKQFINLQLIVFNNSQLHMAWANAQIDLKNIALGKGIESEEFKHAREEHRSRLASFISFN